MKSVCKATIRRPAFQLIYQESIMPVEEKSANVIYELSKTSEGNLYAEVSGGMFKHR